MINIYFDLETTVNGGVKGDSPEAHWDNNSCLLAGWQIDNGPVETGTLHNLTTIIAQRQRVDDVMLVAHNAKFDLKYLMRTTNIINWHDLWVWDTMTYEYRVSGHWQKFTSIGDACALRRIPMKKTLDLGALLATGIKMEDIDIGTLREYLDNDVAMLAALYTEQEKDNYPVDMRYILPLAEMELNGLMVDLPKAQALCGELQETCDTKLALMEQKIKNICCWQDGSAITDDDFDPNVTPKSKYIKAMGARMTSFLLTGVPASVKVAGKWHLEFKVGHRAMMNPSAIAHYFGKAKATNLGYPMPEEVLFSLPHTMCDWVLEHRKAQKLLGTYVGPMLEQAALQGCIYPKLNTTVTNTGRLSSSSPNGQNMPTIVRQLIIPHIPSTHDLTEVDFDQLEIVGAACVSGDTQLQHTLNQGIDTHYVTGKSVMGWKSPADMTKEERTKVKNVNFGILYGGKANGLSHQTGVDISIVKKLIKSFYSQYPRVQQWQEEVLDEIRTNMEPFGIKDGEQVYASLYECPFSGRRYLFQQGKSPQWMRAQTGRAFSFSPQQAANYPIQGFCGGDIVMGALYHMWSNGQLLGHDIKFVLTVHDSILLEVPKGLSIQTILDQACKKVERDFKLPVALGMSEESGPTWK